MSRKRPEDMARHGMRHGSRARSQKRRAGPRAARARRIGASVWGPLPIPAQQTYPRSRCPIPRARKEMDTAAHVGAMARHCMHARCCSAPAAPIDHPSPGPGPAPRRAGATRASPRGLCLPAIGRHAFMQQMCMVCSRGNRCVRVGLPGNAGKRVPASRGARGQLSPADVPHALGPDSLRLPGGLAGRPTVVNDVRKQRLDPMRRAPALPTLFGHDIIKVCSASWAAGGDGRGRRCAGRRPRPWLAHELRGLPAQQPSIPVAMGCRVHQHNGQLVQVGGVTLGMDGD